MYRDLCIGVFFRNFYCVLYRSHAAYLGAIWVAHLLIPRAHAQDECCTRYVLSCRRRNHPAVRWTCCAQHALKLEACDYVLIPPVSVFFLPCSIEGLVSCGNNYCAHIEFEFLWFLFEIYRLSRTGKPAQVAANAVIIDARHKRDCLRKWDIDGFPFSYSEIKLVRNVDRADPGAYINTAFAFFLVYVARLFYSAYFEISRPSFYFFDFRICVKRDIRVILNV